MATGAIESSDGLMSEHVFHPHNHRHMPPAIRDWRIPIRNYQ